MGLLRSLDQVGDTPAFAQAVTWSRSSSPPPTLQHHPPHHTSSTLSPQVGGLLAADQADSHDDKGLMCQLIGDMTGFHALAPFKTSVHALPALRAADGREEEAEDAAEVAPSDVELVVGWVNRMGSGRCVNPSGRDCLRRYAKVTPHTVSIASEDFAAWVEDARDVLGNSAACHNFLFHFRFVMVGWRVGQRWGGKQAGKRVGGERRGREGAGERQSISILRAC